MTLLMKKLNQILFFIGCFFFIVQDAAAKVDPPNYEFSLTELETFAPGASFESLKTKYGKAFPVKSSDGSKVYKFYVAQIRYKFPVYVQIVNDKVIDFYATLPTYFLHDVFHQSLINKLGKQDFYQLVEKNAIYIWNNKNGVKHIYSGTCTITCFPLYYSQIKVGQSGKTDSLRPLVETISKIEAAQKQ